MICKEIGNYGKKHQGYKKKLALRRKSKWVKFIERERKLELREETELHNNIEKPVNGKIFTSVQSKKMIKKEESKDKNDDENHQRLDWVNLC